MAFSSESLPLVHGASEARLERSEADEDGENDEGRIRDSVRLMKQYLELVVSGADQLSAEYEARSRDMSDGNNRSTCVIGTGNPTVIRISKSSYKQLDRIRDISRLLIKILDLPIATQSAVAILQNWDKVFGMVKRVAEVLGVAVVLFGISTIICAYDKKKLQVAGLQRFEVVMEAVDHKIKELVTGIQAITILLEETEREIEKISKSRRVDLKGVDHVLHQMDRIEDEINMCNLRVRFAEKCLAELQRPIKKFKRRFVYTNLGIFGIALGGSCMLYNMEYKVAAISIAAFGGVPLLYTYFSLSTHLDDMLEGIRRREFRLGELKIELRDLSMRLTRMQKKRDKFKEVGGSTSPGE